MEKWKHPELRSGEKFIKNISAGAKITNPFIEKLYRFGERAYNEEGKILIAPLKPLFKR